MTSALPVSLPLVTIYADGACKGNGTAAARGGWGFRAEFANGEPVEKWGGEKPSTNNRMELMSVIEALAGLPAAHEVALFTDSKYVSDGITAWLSGWKRRGWKTSSGEAVKNKELWQQLDSLNGKHRVTWNWVRGHNGHPGNERADELANMGVPD
jgi:ribonuclease HI